MTERYDVRDDQPLADPLPGKPANCPQCESTNIRRFPRLAFAIISILLVVTFDVNMFGGITELTAFGIGTIVILTVLLGGWRCGDCGHGW
jgi:hypothetical protein